MNTICYFTSRDNQIIITSLDLINNVLLPSLLMFFFSILLISSIFKSRRRVNLNNSERENDRLRKDIKFSISSLLMNLLFILLNLPIEIIQIFIAMNKIQTVSSTCNIRYLIIFVLENFKSIK